MKKSVHVIQLTILFLLTFLQADYLKASQQDIHEGYEKTVNESARDIPIAYDVDVVVVGGTSGGVAAAFSGGIDSLYTLWSHNVQNQADPAIRLTNGLFVHGFEIRLHEKDYYHTLYRAYARTFDELGLTLLQARTNLFSFSQFHLNWLYTHPGALAGKL